MLKAHLTIVYFVYPDSYNIFQILNLSLVFLVSGASYEASYKTSLASVLFDFALRERWVKQN